MFISLSVAALLEHTRVASLANPMHPAREAGDGAWMTRCRTGRSAPRAGVPRTWRAGDKTGSGAHGTRNDIAIFRPDGRSLVVAAYLTGASAIDPHARDASLEGVGRIVAATL